MTRRAERAIRRDQRGGLALMHRFAQRYRDREQFFLGIGRLDHADVFHRAVRARAERGIGRVLLPQLGRGGRPQRLRQKLLAAGRVRQFHDRFAGYADAGEQRLQRELRMPRGRRNPLALVAGNQPPGRFVEIGIEARQHHGAMRQSRDGRDQFGGRRDRAGGAGGNDRAVGLARKPRGFGLDQRVAPFRRLDAIAFGKDPRPRLTRDLQKFQRHLPVLVEHVGHEVVEAIPRHAARRHVVDQAREIVGKRARRRGRLRDQRTAARAMHTRANSPIWRQAR